MMAKDTCFKFLSPSILSFEQKAVTFLTEALNRVYSTFEARHAEFNKGVSVVGHGVGEKKKLRYLCG